MPGTTNTDLSSQIGDVREQIGKLMESQRHASSGRQVLHDKLDKVLDAVQTQAVALAEVSKDASLALSGAAQTRDRVDAFDRSITPIITDLAGKVDKLETTNREEVSPLLKIVSQVRALGWVLVFISGLGIVSVGSLFTFFNDTARTMVLNWLGVS